ncbi:MAG: hypothetical protein MUC43_13160, partial [Pirellula sp.]|nr:hypothetical protein [Pirellula sp.]
PSKKSEYQLPEFNKKNLDALLGFCFGKSTVVKPTESKDTLHQSFSDTTLFINGGQTLRIDNKHWSGNILIKADSLIVVRATAQLENVILLSSAGSSRAVLS